MPTSIFSSSFFWSMSVIRRWMTEGDGRTLDEPASRFLMHDYKKKSTQTTLVNHKQFSLEMHVIHRLWAVGGVGSMPEQPLDDEPHHNSSPSRSQCCCFQCQTRPPRRWDCDSQPHEGPTVEVSRAATGCCGSPCCVGAFLAG